MRRLWLLAAMLVGLTGQSTVARAEDPAKAAASRPAPFDEPENTRTQLNPVLGESVEDVPVTVTGYRGISRTGKLIVTIYKPEGPGPFPLVIFNHGRDPSTRGETYRIRNELMAAYFRRRGIVLMLPTRLGYGGTGLVPDIEDTGRCEDSDYFPTSGVVARSAFAVAEWAKGLSYVDGQRILIGGISAGGLGAIRASGLEAPKGVVGYINMSGGLGGSPKHHPDKPCAADGLDMLMRFAGAHAQLPTLWIYSENDHFWGPVLPQQWFADFVAAGGKGTFIKAPPVGSNGHFILSEPQVWRRPLDRFLSDLGLWHPTETAPLPASGFADVDDVSKVPVISEADRETGYRKFLRFDLPRAFAIGPNGRWAAKTGPNAPEEAVKLCESKATGRCALYAVDDTVVWR